MKNTPILRSLCFLLLLATLASAQAPPAQATDELPRAYDLRKSGGVTPVKAQQGGTCWAHGTMAAIESNLLVSGAWKKFGDRDIPALSEYHLDWWNGFNRHCNADLPDVANDPTGLSVHLGGDYRVATAYMSRGNGIVAAPLADKNLADTRSWYGKIPDLFHPSYKRYYVRDVEWFTIGDNLERIDVLKRRIISQGAVGTAMAVNMKEFMAKDFVHYQPTQHQQKPNHAIAIVGWDDDKVSVDFGKKAPHPGCWLIKNSWGIKNAKTGKAMGDQGYYWISYYDKVCCRDPEMGAVSFRNVEPWKYSQVYYHDYHGWRATIKDISKACNVFTAADSHQLASVSFYTAADNVRYTARIYSRFENGQLHGERVSKSGAIGVTGFHTVDLDAPLSVKKGDTFIVCLELSHGGQAIDRTSEIEVLLQPNKKKPEGKQPTKKAPPGPRGPNGGPIVISRANPQESYYFNGLLWRDLYEYRFNNPSWARFDRSANFCMKALAVDAGK